MAFAAVLTATARADETGEISVTGWGTNLNSVPYAVALEQDLFKSNGINVTGILGSTGGGTTVRNVVASSIPYGEVSVDAAISAARNGLDVVIVNAGVRSNVETAWLALPDTKLTGIKDIVGKRVSYTRPKSVSEMQLVLSLKAAGIDPASVTRVAAGGYGEGLTLLDNHAVDLAPVTEPLRSMVESKYKTVILAKDYLPAMITTVGVTTREYAKAHPKVIADLVLAHRQGVQYVYEHPYEAAIMLAKHSKLDAKVVAQSIQHVMAAKFWSEGELDKQELDRMVEGLKLIGDVSGDVDWSKLIDQSYLPADLQRSF